GEAIGIFWEMYGLDPERYPLVTMSLRILAEETGALRRLGQVFGLVPDDNPTRISWEEETLPGEWMARSVVLVIPDLPGGAHTLELTMQVGDLKPFIVRKEIVVGSRTI